MAKGREAIDLHRAYCEESENSASWPFTLEAKVQRPSQSKCLLEIKATDSWRKFGTDGNGDPNYGRDRCCRFFHKKIKSNIDKILAVRLERLFWAMNKLGCSFFFWTLGLAFGGFTLWPSKSRGCGSSWPKVWTLGLGFRRLHIVPGQRLPLLYFIGYLFSTHFFGLSTKFGHSIPRPLNSDTIVWSNPSSTRSHLRTALHLEAGPIRCVRSLKSHLSLVKRLKLAPTPLHLEAKLIWWYDFL
jgi:hypothetical protein